jgi:hypothetical protein
MERDENDAGGTSILLDPGDDLKKVPRSHQYLLTDSLRTAFADPPGHFAGIAKRCPFPNMKRWLNALLAENRWQLQLHQGDPKEWNMAGFEWESEKVHGAIIGLPTGEKLAKLCPTLRQYYKLVGTVHWESFEMDGGLDEGTGDETPMSAFQFDWKGDKIDLASSFLWGNGLSDMLIYTRDDHGGWVAMGGKVHMLGTIEETLEWIYGELLANRPPLFNHEKW